MKDELRKKIIHKRNTLTKSEVLKKSSIIKDKLFEISQFTNSKQILFYVSYGNEVNTHDMIKQSISIGKKVVVPKSVTINYSLILSRIHNWDDLEIGAYNILEPKKELIEEVDIKSIDLIIVPGVVFDIFGNRIGHGKGYYDRLLKTSNKIPTIGLAYEFQIVKNINAEKHDEKIDLIVTEDRIIRRKL